MKFIDLDRQYRAYRADIESAVQGVLESGQFILGPVVEELERTLAEFVGAPHAVGVSSGTDGLLLALMAYGVGAGDKVITTPFTFIATAEVIAFLGAEPVFVDIDPETCNMSTEALASELEKGCDHRLKGIIAVSLYGQCPDMDEIAALARDHGLFLVEDGCQSFGATYRGRRSCGLCEVGVTSFFPAKPLGCYGDGGMVFTSDEEIHQKVRMMRSHGQAKRYRHEVLGINGRLDAMQAAVLLAKFRHFEEEVEARQRAAGRYDALIDELIPGLGRVRVKEGRSSVFAQYTVRVPGGRRDAVQEAMRRQGIPTAVHYPVPLHKQPVFRAYAGLSLPESERAAAEVLSLPMHPFIEPEEQRQVVEALAEALAESGV